MLDDKAQLRDETKQYVPRFIAICKIMRNLDKLVGRVKELEKKLKELESKS